MLRSPLLALAFLVVLASPAAADSLVPDDLSGLQLDEGITFASEGNWLSILDDGGTQVGDAIPLDGTTSFTLSFSGGLLAFTFGGQQGVLTSPTPGAVRIVTYAGTQLTLTSLDRDGTALPLTSPEVQSLWSLDFPQHLHTWIHDPDLASADLWSLSGELSGDFELTTIGLSDPVPEPTTILLFGLAGAGVIARRRKKSAA